jgi:hypothetical protein
MDYLLYNLLLETVVTHDCNNHLGIFDKFSMLNFWPKKIEIKTFNYIAHILDTNEAISIELTIPLKIHYIISKKSTTVIGLNFFPVKFFEYKSIYQSINRLICTGKNSSL